jgi:phosphate transport system ATP-binding protein
MDLSAPVKDSKDSAETVFRVRDLNLWYGALQALRQVSLDVHEHEILAVIGPSGCGKTTFIKALNRIVELAPKVRMTGSIYFRDINITDPQVNVEELRMHIGMVFQKPNPFPKSIFDNVVFGPRILGLRDKRELGDIAEKSLRKAALWDEVMDRLQQNAYGLSGGQQQRLCIARCLAVEPDVLLLDEPTSAIDPVATFMIEDLLDQLKSSYTIIIVTHSLQQASRISDRTAFFLSGEMVEHDRTGRIFSNPRDKRTEDYVSGRFG